jgi:hypothetical protein
LPAYFLRDAPSKNHNARFYLDKNRYIRDRANWANNGLYGVPTGAPENERRLRDCVLGARLNILLRDLFAPQQHTKSNHDFAYDVEQALWAVLSAVGSCHSSPRRERFAEDLQRSKEGMQTFSSLALFVDDVERVLRGLYCNFEAETADRVRRALFYVMRACTSCSLNDLWEEHQDAEILDFGWYGIGQDAGFGINTNEWCAANEAASRIARRARAVRAKPTAFSKYTVQFVQALDEHWPKLDQQRRKKSKGSASR